MGEFSFQQATVTVTAAVCLLGLSAGIPKAAHAEGRPSADSQVPTSAEPRDGKDVPHLAHGASVTLKVSDYDQVSRQIVEYASASGGHKLDSRTDVGRNGRRNGWLRVSVPASQLDSLLVNVRGLGSLAGERVATMDNTSEGQSLGRRVERLKQHEGRLAGVLATRKNLRGSDVLFLQERLFRASVDESLLSQQQQDLYHKDDTSLLTVTLFEPTPIRARDRASRNLAMHWTGVQERAEDSLAALGRRLMTAGAFALVFAPLYLPPLLIVGFLIRRLARRRTPRLAP